MGGLKMSTEEFFKDLDILEQWYDKNYLTLDMYMKIKSNICDCFRKKRKKRIYHFNK